MDSLFPSRAAGICQHPGLEQCLCDCHCLRRRDFGGVAGTSSQPEEGPEGGRACRCGGGQGTVNMKGYVLRTGTGCTIRNGML